MKHQKHILIAVTTLLLLIVVACGGQAQPTAESEAPAAATEAPASQAEETKAEEPAGEAAKVEQVAVLLPASQTDQGWNQQAADSMLAVQAQRGGFEVEVAENLGYGDITPVLRDMADRGFDLLICHASGYQTICPEFAEESGVRVAVVENPDAASDVVADVETQAQEVAYLAGVLAANMSETGTVGVVVSGEPPTWNFMTVGFAEGVKATRPEVEVLYGVIGEAAYEDAAGAKRTTEAQLAAGADIIFGMGDGASFGMLQAIEEHNAAGNKAWFIDVIGDKSADYSDVLLSSVLFDYSNIYTQMIDEIEAGNFGNKVYNMDVASGGVRLLDLPDSVPAEVAQAVEDAKQAILSGAISVSAIGDAEAMRARLDELSQ